ncbi:ANE_G0030870.mRNA.1.CDS.1 [Saccharomyces cerevisiae]|nr:ANE_G0030870.mRNA.1.CDS.1 [Saccharomyces cerevisiae]CAI6753759.1 ANE_G0030870.mRNA.1.CDS.1 [Saccharomyces cerevisiae]
MKENELKNEKSVDVLSVKQAGESQKTVLPQDLSEAAVYLVCYEIYNYLVFASGCYYGPLSVWWKPSNNWIYPLMVSLLVLFWDQYLFLLFLDLSRKRSLSKQLTQFGKENLLKHTKFGSS